MALRWLVGVWAWSSLLTGAGTQPGKGQGCPLQAPPPAAPADEDYYLLALQHLEMV